MGCHDGGAEGAAPGGTWTAAIEGCDGDWGESAGGGASVPRPGDEVLAGTLGELERRRAAVVPGSPAPRARLRLAGNFSAARPGAPSTAAAAASSDGGVDGVVSSGDDLDFPGSPN